MRQSALLSSVLGLHCFCALIKELTCSSRSQLAFEECTINKQGILEKNHARFYIHDLPEFTQPLLDHVKKATPSMDLCYEEPLGKPFNWNDESYPKHITESSVIHREHLQQCGSRLDIWHTHQYATTFHWYRQLHESPLRTLNRSEADVIFISMYDMCMSGGYAGKRYGS